MGKKLGTLIRTARTDAGMTQEQLARKVQDLSASDLSKVERGEKEPTQDQIKQIAKAPGVTQKSLLDAAKSGKSTSSGKSGSKTGSAKTSGVKLTAGEQKLLELYRKADTETRKQAVKVLEGGTGLNLSVDGLLGTALDLLTKK
jgi:transcriptional regulator with XRE-family HTH domain